MCIPFQTNRQQKTTFTTFNREFFLSLWLFELGNLIFLLNLEVNSWNMVTDDARDAWFNRDRDKSKPIKRGFWHTHSFTQSFKHSHTKKAAPFAIENKSGIESRVIWIERYCHNSAFFNDIVACARKKCDVSILSASQIKFNLIYFLLNKSG